jgi:hypothetical protein
MSQFPVNPQRFDPYKSFRVQGEVGTGGTSPASARMRRRGVAIESITVAHRGLAARPFGGRAGGAGDRGPLTAHRAPVGPNRSTRMAAAGSPDAISRSVAESANPAEPHT